MSNPIKDNIKITIYKEIISYNKLNYDLKI